MESSQSLLVFLAGPLGLPGLSAILHIATALTPSYIQAMRHGQESAELKGLE